MVIRAPLVNFKRYLLPRTVGIDVTTTRLKEGTEELRHRNFRRSKTDCISLMSHPKNQEQ